MKYGIKSAVSSTSEASDQKTTCQQVSFWYRSSQQRRHGMQTERRLERYRAADRWPTDEALGAMLDHQLGALIGVRQALPALGTAIRGGGRAASRRRGPAGLCRRRCLGAPRRAGRRRALSHLRLAARAAGLPDRRRRGGPGPVPRGCRGRRRRRARARSSGTASAGTTWWSGSPRPAPPPTRAPPSVAARERGALTIAHGQQSGRTAACRGRARRAARQWA